MAWDAVPMASPRAKGEVTLQIRSHCGPRIAPKIPVAMTRPAANSGSAPIIRLISMAMGVVTDFGTKAATTVELALSSLAVPTAKALP